MRSRSWLIVPGHEEERLGAAIGTGADIVVVDLEDTVPLSEKPRARAFAGQWLAAHRHHVLEQERLGRWVRLNSLESGYTREDLAAVMAHAPDGLILPKASGPEAVRQLASEVYEFEERFGLAVHSTRIVPVAGETPRAALHIADFAEAAHQRLYGLTWSRACLCASLGGPQPRPVEAGLPDAVRFVRAQALLSAHAGEVLAIDAAPEDFADEAAMNRAAQAARRDGFSGMFALHPAQVRAINLAFTPSAEELTEARGLVEAFESSAHAGSLAWGGRMVDRSHLALARRTLAMSEREARASADPRRQTILRPA
ncbi:CoA ester lyase [Novosphingobium profundi]|uniref:HpcH/HpaI aldolase/citrate lyase family protein n=1 Tax=Novosphingobium profundi TaxID=1774954 RepID=UPI001BDA441D|nr:CoA ester lyase [Novosphingobium profundi]MBT0671195.1 CoA ester lyase [Novosphingobium profundi]